MRASADVDDFIRSPIGAYHAAEGFVYGAPDAGLFFIILRGRTSEAETRLLTRLYTSELIAAPHASLFDASALEAVDPSAFGALATFLNDVRERLARVIARQAVVRPPGLPGAAITGFPAVFDIPYQARVFVDRAAALTWLGRPDAGAAIASASEVSTEDRLVARLRTLLSSPLTLSEAARRLGVSERSLQRHLRDAGTSFQEERRAAWLVTARRLLIDTDRKLAAIASELGCASLQSFSAMFRRLAGEAPSDFRARHR